MTRGRPKSKEALLLKLADLYQTLAFIEETKNKCLMKIHKAEDAIRRIDEQ